MPAVLSARVVQMATGCSDLCPPKHQFILEFESTFEFRENKNPSRHRVSLKRRTTCKRDTSGPGFLQHGAIEIMTLPEAAAALVITQRGNAGSFSQVLKTHLFHSFAENNQKQQYGPIPSHCLTFSLKARRQAGFSPQFTMTSSPVSPCPCQGVGVHITRVTHHHTPLSCQFLSPSVETLAVPTENLILH